jgi:hypothetical protein
MKNIDLGQTISILANIGVIAGIVFLGFELRQSQVVGRAQTQTAIADARRELSQSDIAGPMAGILVRVTHDEPLSEEDEIRLRMWTDAWLRHYENVYYQNLQGLYDDDGFDANMREIKEWLEEVSSARNIFCQSRESRSSRFGAMIDEMLGKPCD